ncbi:hypothetical protein MMC06_002394 [Schaereria dolodes]|nr:hypothetical protein [Schaereria dolodes]
MDQELAQQMTLCESAINQIEALLSSNPSNWRSCLEVARSIIAALDGSELLSRTSLLDEQLKLARTLQKLAYQDPDSGGEADIASWCVRQWATMLQRHPDTIEILKGLGHAWLLKSQACLARIERDEKNGSGSDSSSSNCATRAQDIRNEHSRDENRIHTSDYVEARGLLRPALENLSRAVNIAETQGGADGPLLTLAAEAYMHFGNVSHPQANEYYYRQALQYLREASQVLNYSLEPHLQQYLTDNMRLYA